MRIFDSHRSRKWFGTGFTAKETCLSILKIAKFYHQVELKAGEYTLRVVGRKRAGTGGMNVDILSGSNSVLNKYSLDFSSAWSEQVFQFKLEADIGLSKIEINRAKNSVGTLEISKIALDAKALINNAIKEDLVNKNRLSISARIVEDVRGTKIIEYQYDESGLVVLPGEFI
jgi:hypothetical protein